MSMPIHHPPVSYINIMLRKMDMVFARVAWVSTLFSGNNHLIMVYELVELTTDQEPGVRSAIPRHE